VAMVMVVMVVMVVMGPIGLRLLGPQRLCGRQPVAVAAATPFNPKDSYPAEISSA